MSGDPIKAGQAVKSFYREIVKELVSSSGMLDRNTYAFYCRVP